MGKLKFGKLVKFGIWGIWKNQRIWEFWNFKFGNLDKFELGIWGILRIWSLQNLRSLGNGRIEIWKVWGIRRILNLGELENRRIWEFGEF